MKRFNAAMQIVFICIGFIGFLKMCSVYTDSENWLNEFAISFLIFLTGYVGCMIFNNPKKFFRSILAFVIILFAFLYGLIHNLYNIMKNSYKYKTHCGGYNKTYRRISNYRSVNNSKQR